VAGNTHTHSAFTKYTQLILLTQSSDNTHTHTHTHTHTQSYIERASKPKKRPIWE